jgi:hypothetical protein
MGPVPLPLDLVQALERAMAVNLQPETSRLRPSKYSSILAMQSQRCAFYVQRNLGIDSVLFLGLLTA